MSMINRRVRESLDTATSRARETIDKASELALNTAEAIEEVSSSSLEFSKSASQDLVQGSAEIATQLRRIPAGAVDQLFPECPVPMFLMPVGPSPEEYTIIFDFNEVFESLQSGIFVRPKIEAWAAFDTHANIECLCEELKVEFARQFEKTREQNIRAGRSEVRDLDKRIQRQSRQMDGKLADAGSSLIKAPIEATLGTLMLNPVTGIFTWPIGLIYLGLAIYNGHKAISLPLEYAELLLANTGNRLNKKSLELDLKNLEAEFDSKNQAFQRAVSKIEFHLHPKLYALYQLICQKEKAAYQPISIGTGPLDSPNVRPYLENRDFQNRLPRKYRSLLKSL